MKKFLVIFFILILGFSVSAQTKRPIVKPTPKLTPKNTTPISETEAITKDGKKVILKSDKTWDFAIKETTSAQEPKTNQKPGDALTANTHGASSTPCKLTLADAPELSGLKLGMKTEMVLKMIGPPSELATFTGIGAKLEDSKVVATFQDKVYSVDVGKKKYDYSPHEHKDSSKFAGVRHMSFEFFDDSVYEIYISYANRDFSWKDTPEFTEVLSKKLNLPAESWSFRVGNAILKCTDFDLIAGADFSGAIISLTDKTAIIKMERAAQQAAAEEDKRQTEIKRLFKP